MRSFNNYDGADNHEILNLLSKRSREVLDKFRRRNFQIKCFFHQSYVYALMRCPLGFMRRFAATIDFPMLLDSEMAEKYSKDTKFLGNDISPLSIPHDPSISRYKPFEYIYAKYDQGIFDGEGHMQHAMPEDIYWRPREFNHPFRPYIRLVLLKYIIESKSVGGCGLNMERLKQDGIIESFFPLHDVEEGGEVEWLRKNWSPRMHKCRWLQPLERVKEYFGVKIALYFAFVEYYNISLLAPTAIGVVLQVAIIMTAGPSPAVSSPVLPFFSIFVLLWATTFLKSWENYESVLAMKWGVSNIEDIEVDRVQYQGEQRPDIVTGQISTYFSSKEKRRRLLFSFTVCDNNYMPYKDYIHRI